MQPTFSFLTRSNQRVLDHCRRLLAARDLAVAERRRLERLAQEAQVALAANSLAANSDEQRGELWAA